MKRIILAGAVLLLAASFAAAQGKPLKVYISADMEGIGGVSTGVQTGSQGREYEKFRRLMTEEVNAAIAGAFDAGASEVLVSDSHGDGQNIDVELLDKRARLIRAWPRPLGMMQGVDDSFGAVVFVGYHASEGQAAAIISHTFNGRTVVKLNGVEVPEAGVSAAIAGDFGVPVVFVSGDQTIGEETPAAAGAHRDGSGEAGHRVLLRHHDASRRSAAVDPRRRQARRRPAGRTQTLQDYTSGEGGAHAVRHGGRGSGGLFARY